ncbi:group II intron reverse transcriptase/maturase [Methyloprofundus sedimenti]|uniref:Group II intron reverse transcriptase/maturase n=2 Tax=Methyloprofundus sedimenti TaxID=1420851 RepID=A0A1V8M8Z0_9GAMM|nr:group II intron reverse transcriptase/maturase [Methyloprofundus sedimenti]OQK18074.1 group II intron reverse transcriptase/maturase [Methyloprofundus sedimenti]
MNEHDLLIEEPRLFDQLCSTLYLGVAFKQVKKNKGKPGIDGITIADFETRLDEELSQLQEELANWTYQPSPVRRVEIAKPGGKGVRLLGIPTVRDRVVQTTLKLLLEPVFDPHFSPHSYGFRPGRSQHEAVQAAQQIVNSGKPYVVDIDLSKFFDRIHHDRLIARMGEKISDKRILRLVGNMLRSGVMINGIVNPSKEGAMQGGSLSPLLSNIVLDELDQELEKRGLEFCRYADDCNIFVKSQKAADRVMEKVSQFIEKKLKLKVNQEKSQVAKSDAVKFLGFTVVKGTIAIAHKALQTAMSKIEELTPRGTHQTLDTSLDEINQWYVGWSNYYSLTYYPSQLNKIEAHIRRRLRSRIVDQQKRKQHLYRKLAKRGVPRKQASKAVFSNNKRWQLSNARAVTRAYPNSWFINLKGQEIRSDRKLEHWFEVSQWIRLA